jgi:hypothetical protein
MTDVYWRRNLRDPRDCWADVPQRCGPIADYEGEAGAVSTSRGIEGKKGR